jgi:hypothetical protein
MLCDDCRNDGICKYATEARRMWQQARGIMPDNILCPVRVKAECSKFEKKGQKQDGIYGCTFTKGGAK